MTEFVADRRYRVVIIEDNPGDVYLIREALREAGLRCDYQVYSDGAEALEALLPKDGGESEVAPDVILLDLNLPKISGEQVLDTMRRIERCAAIPVVVLTSSDSPRDRERATALGATLYVRKPSNLDEFLRIGSIVREICLKLGNSEPA